MSKILAIFSVFLAVSEALSIPTRFRRQYGWGGSPYYNAAQYYETQPQQWSSQYQNNQNYYSPYFYGYQRQQNWQTSNQNAYPSQYNRPSWISENNNGYATAPPTTSYNQANSGYGRPKYLATMQPKQTLSPVILERSTLFVTAEPMKTTETDGRHPTFLERLGVATLPVVPTITSSEEEALEKAEEALKIAEHETLGNGETLPERPSEKEESVEEETRIVSSTTTEETTSTEPVLEKDEIVSSEFFSSSTEESTIESSTTEISSTSEEPTTTEVEETTTETATEATEVTTVSPTTEEPSTTTTTTTPAPTTTVMTTTEPVTTTAVPVKEVKPVTLLAFQEVTNEVTSNVMNVTQPTVDQSTSVGDLNEIGEGSGSEAGATPEVTSRSTFTTGIVGLRAPPVPKTTDLENVGLAVVEWTDSDNEVRKTLLTQ